MVLGIDFDVFAAVCPRLEAAAGSQRRTYQPTSIDGFCSRLQINPLVSLPERKKKIAAGRKKDLKTQKAKNLLASFFSFPEFPLGKTRLDFLFLLLALISDEEKELGGTKIMLADGSDASRCVKWSEALTLFKLSGRFKDAFLSRRPSPQHLSCSGRDIAYSE